MTGMAAPEDGKPLDLGTLTPASADDGAGPSGGSSPGPGGPSAPWRQRAAIALALVVGGTVGAVATDARHDAAEAHQAELVASAAAPRTFLGSAELAMLNTAEQAVDIVDVTLPGWARPPGADEPPVVTAEPDVWLTFDTRAEPQCDAEPSLDATVTAITNAGDRVTAELTVLDQYNQLDRRWQQKCETLDGDGLSFDEPTAVSSDAETATITIPVRNGLERPGRIVGLGTEAPGFVADSADLPLTVSAGESTTLTITWTVDDCAAAAEVDSPTATADFVSGDLRRRLTHFLPNTVLVELVRVAERVCGT